MRVSRALIPVVMACAAVAVLSGCTSASAAASAGSVRPTTVASPSRSVSSGPGAPVIVAIGDSIMNGFGLEDGQDWPTLLADDRDDTVYNYGCNGGGFIAVGTCGTDFVGLIPEGVKQHPEIVFVQGSDNDGAQAEPALTAATFAMVAELHRELPRAQIVGLNTLWDQPSKAPAEIAYSSRAVEDAVKSVGGVYLDIGQPIAGHAGLVQSDNEHPTTKGQQVLLAAVEAACDKAGVGI